MLEWSELQHKERVHVGREEGGREGGRERERPRPVISEARGNLCLLYGKYYMYLLLYMYM